VSTKEHLYNSNNTGFLTQDKTNNRKYKKNLIQETFKHYVSVGKLNTFKS